MNYLDYLVSEPNYDTKNFSFFFENLIAIETKTTWMLLNKPVYLGLLILEISNTVKYELTYIKIFKK